MLVDARTWLPMRLALRWVVYARRYAVRESTLRGDLDALRHVYDWGEGAFAGGLEGRLADGSALTHAELLLLAAHLRAPRRTADSVSDSAAGRRALAALSFLMWALVPAERNERGAPPDDLHRQVAQLEAVLRPVARLAARGKRIRPVEFSVADRIERLISPITDANGRYLRPLRFAPGNPFRPTNRLRNWLMWLLGIEAGLRKGEMLALLADDFPTVAGEKCVLVVVRQDELHDPRAQRPEAKTVSRAIPLSQRAQAALRAYLTERPPHGRKRGSPYLFTSTGGRPLSLSAADGVITKMWEGGVLSAVGEDALAADLAQPISWHSLRHAWAETLAAHLLEGEKKDLVIDKLRYLGGWSPTSQQPAHYAQLAIGAAARKDLAERQRRFASHITNRNRDDLSDSPL